MTQAYDIGDAPRLAVAFTDYADAAADPTTISFVITEPDGVVVTYVYLTAEELVKDSTGNYHVDYAISKAGRHSFKFVGTGDVVSTQQSEFYVRKVIVQAVSLAQAKDQMNIDFSDDDALIDMLIEAARDAVQNETGRILINETLVQKRDGFDVAMELPYAAQSVTSITYIDTDGAVQTLAATEYDVDTDRTPALITLAYDKTYPDTRATHNAVTITYVSGYGENSQDVPSALRSAMLLLIAHLYENREATAPININDVPLTLKYLLGPYKLYNF